MKHESTSVSTTGRHRAIWCSRLAVCLLTAALAVTAQAYLPPGATPAPNTAQTAAAFPKRVTAQGSNFGVWSQATVNPLYGRTGYYADTDVAVTSGSTISGMLEFDAAGNTVRRISPLQLGVNVIPGTVAGQFFAQQVLTGASDVTFGLYSATNGNAAVYQHKLTANPAKTIITQAGALGRSVVTQDLNTQIEVIVFRSDGTVEWARRYSSTFFGTALPSDTQTAFVIPLQDGSFLLEIVKFGVNLTTFSIGYDTAVIKLSSTGAVEWAKKPVANANFIAIPSATGNFFYLTGIEVSLSGSVGATVTKLTPAGALVWSKRVNGPYVAAAGDLTGDKVVLTGYTATAQNPIGASVVAIVGSTGNLETQAQFSFGTRNSTVVFPEGSRLWIATTAGNLPSNSGTLDAGPAHIGLADATLTNIRWKRYKNPMHIALANPDFDSDDVVASFFHQGDHAMEVVAFKDDFAASVNSDLLQDATATITSPGISLTDSGYTITDLSVTSTSVTPTLQVGALTFESLPTIESSIGTPSGGGGGTPTTPTIATQPAAQTVAPGAVATFSVTLNNPSNLSATYQWRLNGAPIAGATSATYSINSAQPANVGLYSVEVVSNGTTFTSTAALLSLNATVRPIGQSVLFASDIAHPNGNIYDQFLMTGASSTITADPGQVARISFVDSNDDIVQVEYSGPGTLTLTLANASGPAVAVNYNQPTVSYMKGLPTITITGADQTSNLGIFSVGSLTGNVLVLKSGVTYDGLANIALINISSTNGQFGGVRIGNALLSASSGDTGLNAPGVNFTGPIVIHDIDATGTANPKLLTGTVAGLAGFAGEIRIAGGNLLQTNNRSIEYGTATAVRMAAGTNSHSVSLPAVSNQGRLVRNGADVTASVIVGP
ncbi:MAG: hypothetical protein JNN01_07080 [Opitutaceae bacterium]|nr:hypothetical protein [Opitutaceae bacterium]